MATTDIFPLQKDNLRAWTEHFLNVAQANAVAWGLDPAEVADAVAAQASFAAALREQLEAINLAQAATRTQKAAQADLKRRVRRLARRISSTPAISDGDRLGMGLRLRDRNPTKSPVPASHPVVTIDTRLRLRHILRIVDANATDSRGRPAKTMGCEIWIAIGPEAPSDPKGFQYQGMATKSKHEVELLGENAGKTAHYLARWLNTRGEPGPFSETASATIVG